MTQQSYGGQGLTGEFRQWRIPAGWLIQIELAWLAAACFIGGYLGSLPADNWAAWAYRTYTGGNALGLFVLGNGAGYLIYEEVRMVLSGMFHREKVADIQAAEARLNGLIAAAVSKAIADKVEPAAAEARLNGLIAAAVSKAVADTVEPAVNQAAVAARAAALEEYRLAVAAWYERQQAAQREGRPFDEPPPGYGGKGGGPAG